MKVFYLSSTAYSDNQMSILHNLAKSVDLTYGVIIPYANSNYSKSEIEEYCLDHNIKVIFFELKYRFRSPKLITIYSGILRKIKEQKPDIIYFANFDQLYLNILLLQLPKRKVIIALPDVESHQKTAFGKLADLSKKLLIKRFTFFQTFSSIQETLLLTQAPNKNVFNIPLPLIDFGPINQKKGYTNNVTFLFFGFIQYYKGLDLLINAFNAIAKTKNNIKLVIAGRGRNWHEIYEPLTQNNSQIECQIRFIENKEIPRLFANADYLVLPYRDSTQSGPLMIAYNYNIPVIFSNAKGFLEFTSEGKTGEKFDLEKPGDLERVLLESADRSPDQYLEMKKRQQFYVNKEFSSSELIDKYIVMFNNVYNYNKRNEGR